MSNSFNNNHTRPPERPPSQASQAPSRPGSAIVRPAPRVTTFGQGPRAPYSLRSTPAPSSSRLSPNSQFHADTRRDDDAVLMPPPTVVPSQGVRGRGTSSRQTPELNWTTLSDPWQPARDSQLMGAVDPYTAQLSEIRHRDRPQSSITVGRPLDPSISPLDTTPTPPPVRDIIDTQDRERAVRAQEQQRVSQPWPSPSTQAAIDRSLRPSPPRDPSEPAPDSLQASFVQHTDSGVIPLDADSLPIPEDGRQWGSLETLRGVYIIGNNNPFIYSGEEREKAFRAAYNLFNRARPNKRSFESFKRQMDKCLAMKLLEGDIDNKVLKKKAEGVKMTDDHRQAAMVRLEKIAGERERYLKLSADQKEAQAEEDTKKKRAGEAMKRRACQTAGTKRSAREAMASELEDSDSESSSDVDSDDMPARRTGKGKAPASRPGNAVARRVPRTPQARTPSKPSPRRRRVRSVSKSPRTRSRRHPTKKRRSDVAQSTADLLEDSISKASEDRRRLEELLRDTSGKQQSTVDKLVGHLGDLTAALINGGLKDSGQSSGSSGSATRGHRSRQSRRAEADYDVEMRTPSPSPVRPSPSALADTQSATRMRDSIDEFFGATSSASPTRTPRFDLEATASPDLQPSRSQARPSADVHLDMLAMRGRQQEARRGPSPAQGVPSSSRQQISSQAPILDLIDSPSRSPSRSSRSSSRSSSHSSSHSALLHSAPSTPISSQPSFEGAPDLRAFLSQSFGEEHADAVLSHYWGEEPDV